MKHRCFKVIGMIFLLLFMFVAAPSLSSAEEQMGGQVSSKGSIGFSSPEQTKTDLTKNKLPQTGEKEQNVFLIRTSGLLTLVSFAYLFKKHKEGECE